MVELVFANSTVMVVIVVVSSSELIVELIAFWVINNGEKIGFTI